MDELIINEFYNKILIEATGGVIDIDGFKFNIEFQTKINDESKYLNENVFETLEIKNKETFDKLLILYTKKMYEFIINSNFKNIDYVYYEGNKTYIIDFILSSVWNNVTNDNMQNPVEYLQDRINFIDNSLCSLDDNYTLIKNADVLQNSDISFSIEKNNLILETPYSFCPNIVRDKEINEIFPLPKVYFGISNNKCFIYSVKNDKCNTDNSYTKKINRILYKVNKNIDDDYELDNIKDVSPSALISISMFLKVLKEKNISNVNIVDFMPIRYKAKKFALNKKLTKLQKTLTKEELDNMKINIQKEQEKIQNNMTDKLLRNFRRLEYHGFINITSYPKDIDSNMHIKINDNVKEFDNILNTLYSEDPNNIKIK